ncbi:MAG TPA: arylsulfotransferase family protein [Solirubrobacteraceae bacterium]|jgi:hypothetical protein|nr:arylsulfotransferase family protein [Solirubrobacteraceae bacterium]
MLLALGAAGLAPLLAGGCGGSSDAATSKVLEAPASARTAQSDPVTVSPLPGTPDAETGTQISFLGEAGTSVSGVRVVGSSSGAHGGTLRPYSSNTGESFLPSHPFRPGEHVTVTATITGGPGAGATARTSFTIARAAAVSSKEFPLDAGNPSDVQRYASLPSIRPSQVHITTPARPGASPGDLFLAPYQGPGTAGPMIVDQSGRLIWFHPLPRGIDATNFGVQPYGGAPVLTWWQGRILEVGFGQGEDVIYDSSYRRIGVVHAGNGLHADLHVIRLTPQGTAWIDAYEPIHMNLASARGNANGVISDSVAQEIDVRTGLVMWEWHALGHIPLADSKNPAPKSSYPWDYVHINAIDPGSEGDVLMSFRNTWSLDDVDMHSGGFRWLIGSAHSTFTLGPGVKFYWQHDAAFEPGGLISLFDNGSDPPEEKQSRGLVLEPNLSSHSVRLVHQFVNPSKRLLASSQGDTQSLPGGNWLLGYGGLPNFTEYDSAGNVLLDGSLGRGIQSFTSRLFPWSATAPGAPAIAKVPSHGGIGVAVSWNGATAVASWRLLAGPSAAALTPAATAARSGFETVITTSAAGPYAEAQALDAAGAVLATSGVIKV